MIVEEKTLKKILQKFFKEKRKPYNKKNLKEEKKQMKQADNSFKSIMEIHDILVNIYNKIVKK